MRRFLLEKKRLYKNAMAVIALVAALAGAIAAVWKLYQTPSTAQDEMTVREVTEIVVDRAESMGAEFEGGTRLQAAIESARSALDSLANTDMLALREFGGPCGRDNTRLVVKPGQKNKQKIQRSLGTLAAGGQAGLANAVIEATGDFDDSERFKRVTKRIVVITGSRDTCSRGDPIAAIRNRMERIKGANIRLDFHFIGIGLGSAEREDVSRIAGAAGPHKPVFVDRRQDLEGALRKVLVVEPVVKDTQSVVTLLNAGVDHLNGVFAAIGKRDYAAAEAGLKEARNESGRSDPSMDELGKGQRKEQFKKLYETAAESRRIRDELLNLAGKMLAQAQANNVEGYNASAAEFNRLSDAFNRNGKSITTLLDEMRQ